MICLPLIGSMAEMPEELANLMWVYAGVGVFYLVMSVFFIFPALRLTKFSMKVSKLQESPAESGLVEVLNEQRGFWKAMGIWRRKWKWRK